MPRAGTVSLLAVVGVGLLALIVVAASDQRQLAFTLGVRELEVAASVPPGHEACQRPIDVSARFRAVQFRLAASSGPVVPLVVTVRDASRGKLLGRGRIERGYRSGSSPIVDVGGVPAGSRVAVCVMNGGRRTIGLWGGPSITARTTHATLDGRPVGTDIGFAFVRDHPASLLSLVPSMLERMALFRPHFVGVWTYWLLLVLLLLGVPLLLVLGLREAEREA